LAEWGLAAFPEAVGKRQPWAIEDTETPETLNANNGRVYFEAAPRPQAKGFASTDASGARTEGSSMARGFCMDGDSRILYI
jgi:hypothetical protein